MAKYRTYSIEFPLQLSRVPAQAGMLLGALRPRSTTRLNLKSHSSTWTSRVRSSATFVRLTAPETLHVRGRSAFRHLPERSGPGYRYPARPSGLWANDLCIGLQFPADHIVLIAPLRASPLDARRLRAIRVRTDDVDDEPSIRVLVTDILADVGCTAIEANDGPLALKVLQSGARINLVVTGVGLPNGRQVADAMWSPRPDLRVLFITAMPRMPSWPRPSRTRHTGGQQALCNGDSGG